MEFLPLAWHLLMGQSLYRGLQKVQSHKKRKYIVIYTNITPILTVCSNPELSVANTIRTVTTSQNMNVSLGEVIEWL